MSHKRRGRPLGQHFLTSFGAVQSIVEAGKLSNKDTVLEIGPGRGILTEQLLLLAKKVIAVEKDPDLVAFLQKRFALEIKSGKLLLIEEDIRNFNPKIYNLQPTTYKLIANIPYYITGEIFRQFLESATQPATMVMLIQKEVAERIMARNNKESLLSLSVKAYGKPKIIRNVPRGSFNPPPNVDSAIIKITDISKKSFTKISENDFFDLIHLGFAHKRKQLMGNLRNRYSKSLLEKAFLDLKLDFKVRPEDIAINTWFLLLRRLIEE